MACVTVEESWAPQVKVGLESGVKEGNSWLLICGALTVSVESLSCAGCGTFGGEDEFVDTLLETAGGSGVWETVRLRAVRMLRARCRLRSIRILCAMVSSAAVDAVTSGGALMVLCPVEERRACCWWAV